MTSMLLLVFQMKIFFPGSKSTAYVALRLIKIQNLPGLRGQRRIDLEQTLCYILMYGRYYLERYYFLPY